jgi:hypothetical protein
VFDVADGFLSAEINTQELYEEIVDFVTSFHIRTGEFEGNEYIIYKIDRMNFILFPEYDEGDSGRAIPGAEAIYRDELLKLINNTAAEKGIKITNSN